jgi:hypothetical protein
MIVGFQKLKKASESLNQLIQVIRDPTLLSSGHFLSSVISRVFARREIRGQQGFATT